MTSLRASRTKARHTKTVIIALIAMIGLSVSGGLVAAEHDQQGLEQHCPDHQDHPNKVDGPQANSTHNVTVDNMTIWLLFSEDLKSVEFFADENLTVPIAVKFCIKAGPLAGGKETGTEGHVFWNNHGGQTPEISYVVVYKIIEDEREPEEPEPVCIGPQWITGSAHANPPMNQLEWDSFPNATGYALYRATAGGNFSLLSQTDANTTSYSDFDVEVGTTYQYRVTAKLNGEETDHCDEVEITAIPVFATLLAGALAGVLAIGAYASIRRKD